MINGILVPKNVGLAITAATARETAAIAAVTAHILEAASTAQACQKGGNPSRRTTATASALLGHAENSKS